MAEYLVAIGMVLFVVAVGLYGHYRSLYDPKVFDSELDDFIKAECERRQRRSTDA